MVHYAGESLQILQKLLIIFIALIYQIMMVVINDVMAYMFGFFFGRTPLIQLSPKKTWEGFIGGGVSSMIRKHRVSTSNVDYMFADINCNDNFGSFSLCLSVFLSGLSNW